MNDRSLRIVFLLLAVLVSLAAWGSAYVGFYLVRQYW